MNINIKKLIPGAIAIVLAIVLFILANIAPIKLVGKWIVKESEIKDSAEFWASMCEAQLEDEDDVDKVEKVLAKNLEMGMKFTLFGKVEYVNNLNQSLLKIAKYIDEDERDDFKEELEEEIEEAKEESKEVTYKYSVDGNKIKVVEYVDGDKEDSEKFKFKFSDGYLKLTYDGDSEKFEKKGLVTLSRVMVLVGIILLLGGAFIIYMALTKASVGTAEGAGFEAVAVAPVVPAAPVEEVAAEEPKEMPAPPAEEATEGEADAPAEEATESETVAPAEDL